MAFDDYLGAERARMQTQPQAPQAPAYMFRDDRNAMLDRQQQTQSDAARTTPQGGPFAPAKPGTGFDAFSKDLEAGAPAAKAPGNNPFAPADTKGMVSGAISRLLSNPTGGFDASTALARESALKKDQQANEDLRSQAALQFLPGTGQTLAPAQQQTDAQRLAMRDFDLQAASGHANAEQQGLQTGAQLGLQQEGQRISAEQAARQLAETQRQFNETLPIQAAQARSAADIAQGQLGVSQGQLALNQQLGTGDLTLREKQLSQNASQFQDQLSFQKWAAQQGFTEQEAQRAWQAQQNQAQIGSQEKIAFAGLSQQDKQLAQQAMQFNSQLDWQKKATQMGLDNDSAQRAWQAAENEKNRQAQQQQFSQSLGLQQQQFDLSKQLGLGNLSLEQQKVINQASQFTSDLDFKKAAMQSGIDQHTADLAWQANQAAIDQKWKTGERLSSQEFTTLINSSQQTYEAAQNNLNRALQEKLQGNTQAFEAAQTAAAQVFQQKMQSGSFSHDEAMAASQQAFTQKMQEAGYDHETAMQTAQLAQQANLAKQQMDLQETMHMADLAQQDKQFGARLGLDYQQLDQQQGQFFADLQQRADQFSKEFGLKSDQVHQAMQSQGFQDSLQHAMIGLELVKDNPQAMQALAKNLATTMGKAMGFSDDQIKAGAAKPIESMFDGSTTSGTTALPANNNTVSQGMDVLASEVGKLNSGVTVDKLRPYVQELGNSWNGTGGLKEMVDSGNPTAYAVLINNIDPLIKAGMSVDSVKKVLPFIPGDVIERTLRNAGVI